MVDIVIQIIEAGEVTITIIIVINQEVAIKVHINIKITVIMVMSIRDQNKFQRIVIKIQF